MFESDYYRYPPHTKIKDRRTNAEKIRDFYFEQEVLRGSSIRISKQEDIYVGKSEYEAYEISRVRLDQAENAVRLERQGSISSADVKSFDELLEKVNIFYKDLMSNPEYGKIRIDFVTDEDLLDYLSKNIK